MINSQSSIQILILTANPKKTEQLRLGEEVREIEEILQRANQRDRFERPLQRWAVTPRTMQQAIVEESPNIVHFSGHGEGKDGIILEDLAGQPRPVSAEALAGLFSLCEQVECVVLNACHSDMQADAIAQHIPYVIGMKQAVGDRAAIEFAIGFYGALGSGKSYREAFELGRSMIRMMGIAEADVPVLRQKVAPETTPTLWVHGWAKQLYSGQPTAELDWTSHFDKQPYRIPAPTVWQSQLLPELAAIRKEWAIAYVNKQITLRGKLSLTTLLAIGFSFPQVGGYQFEVEQITAGETQIWRSDTLSSNCKFRVVKAVGKPGENLLMALSITGDAKNDVKQLVQRSQNFSAVAYAEPESGVSPTAIASDADAVALANHAKQLINEYRRQYCANRVHLVLYAPAGFCLFLGQKLNAVGEIVAYEHAGNEGYQLSLILNT